MRKKRRKHQRNKGCPSNNESESPTAIPAEETGFRNKLISRFSWCDLSRDPDLKQLIENLTPWVAFKRFLIVVDNIAAAALFGLFSLWLHNWLDYDKDYNVIAAISQSIQDVKLNFRTEIFYFLLYYIAFARPIRLTKIMPLNYYITDRLAVAVIIGITVISFAFMGSSYVISTSKIGYSIYVYPYTLPAISTSVALVLFLYRRVYLTVHIKWFVPDIHYNNMKEEMSINVAIKRLLVIVDNITATSVFCFFVLWLNNYLGYNEGHDFFSAISASFHDIGTEPQKETLFFLLCYLLLARPIRLTKRMPLKNYIINRTAFIIMLVITILCFAFTELYYETARYYESGGIRQQYPQIVPSIAYSVAFSLAFYRRVYMKYHIEWFDRKKQK